MFRSKRGTYRIQDLLPVALILVIATVGIAIGAQVLDNIQTGYVTGTTDCGLNSTGGTSGTLVYSGCGAAYNVTTVGLEAQGELGSWLDTIALIVAAAIIIGVLVTSFMVGTR